GIWIVDGPQLAPDTVQQLLAPGRFAGVVPSDLELFEEACAIPELLVALDCARRTSDAGRVAQLSAEFRDFRERAAKLPPLVAVKETGALAGASGGAPRGGGGRGGGELVPRIVASPSWWRVVAREDGRHRLVRRWFRAASST